MRINTGDMTLKSAVAVLLVAASFVLGGCSSREKLKVEVQPIADAMCKFIDIQNQMKTAAEAGDSLAVDSLGRIRHQLQIEMTVLNQEFNKKFERKTQDEKWLRDYKKAMNEALLECPHLSAQDREMMEKGQE